MKTHTRTLINLLKQGLDTPLCGAEVGVWRGENAAHLLQEFERLRLYLVDNWRHPAINAMGMPNDYADARETATMNVARFGPRAIVAEDTSLAVADTLPAAVLDFVFLDASHEYEAVKKDLWAWWSKVRTGGILCGHDYDGRGDKSGKFGVKKAVDEFAEKGGYQVHKQAARIWWTRV